VARAVKLCEFCQKNSAHLNEALGWDQISGHLKTALNVLNAVKTKNPVGLLELNAQGSRAFFEKSDFAFMRKLLVFSSAIIKTLEIVDPNDKKKYYEYISNFYFYSIHQYATTPQRQEHV